ncbi:MAG: phosphoglycerate dehydrogenase [Firmicutes bacterium]|nr:phosphoglycerate dehydrogenase [Bacillota bacterium]
MYYIRLYDHLADAGRKIFSDTKYTIKETGDHPDGIMVHSTPLFDIPLNPELKSIVRIGAGVNTIPVDECTKKGICVFNCPGGNANAVKELTLAAIIMTMRNGVAAMNWVKSLPGDESDPGKTVEKGKDVFKGPEIMGKTIGIIGVGAIGSRMARACDDLGMKVYGYDPYLSHSRVQELRQYAEFVDDVDELLEKCDIVTVHIPLDEKNKDFIDAEKIGKMKDGVYLVNYARGPIVNDDALLAALDSGKVKAYITDFPTTRQMKHENVFFTPHLGAGTPEADENCAVMAAKQTIDYIENGNITNSVNFPDVSFARADGARVTVIHENKVGMLGLMTEKIAADGLNIENLVNKARGALAYTIFDFNTGVPDDLADKLSAIDGVIRVRVID